MGKHKHSKDKLYILQSEYRRDALIKKQIKSRNSTYLPFNYCCISLRPFTDPYCDEDGRLYDKKSVLEEMEKSIRNKNSKPEIDIKNLIKVNFYKHDNEYICPITRKYFNKHTKIILNKKTGNTFSSEIFKLFPNKNEMFDPITHDSMNMLDLIVLQDPLNNKHNMNELHNQFVQKEKEKTQHIQENGAIMSILQEVKNKQMENNKLDANKNNDKDKHSRFKDDYKNEKREKNKYLYSTNKDNENSYIEDDSNSENEIKIKCENYSDNKLAQSVTSTIYNATYKNTFVYLPEAQVHDMIYTNVIKNKKNSYIRLITDVGMINIELYAYKCPKLCHNFLFLCEYKYYNKTDIFKRDKDIDIVYLGARKNNIHSAASGFYWRKKLKKYKLRKKIDNEKIINKLKEEINVNSDNDSDIGIKYLRYNDNRHTAETNSYGNIYMFKYYNQKYSNMFYISLSEDYTTNNPCIGKVVGGNDTLEKLKNLDTTSMNDEHYTLNETIIYTNPFKEVIKEMKEDSKKKNIPEPPKEKPKTFIDDDIFVENKNDDIGKYIKWQNFKNNNKNANSDESKLNILKKENASKPKQAKMDFSCW
ncbi:peptidyl-prolyl cis-trans isomerase, putative [Plasmodium chabaudi chabaudi]|uniref:Peptidyl-prolyl cis-trans isomerase, putative n=1 Tax=Plasmodium chabaudi chabaudi TaxID=31271 RepID=A0A4V0K8I4_PLACU|nr:peptidyl-prolyl cis-trans isomerase, putative [Plasmodium chabaudi chabaudi]VTZ68526.1 peptidyl-prolyl cis-trans isomerase, putative [Plasmodium chabaudi chabaudi]|eukprot:XP_016653856.1 peptidyl-prolyl cis-trans isomerase, putative [Plasmodium chabaudi chabaudi]